MLFLSAIKNSQARFNLHVLKTRPEEEMLPLDHLSLIFLDKNDATQTII